MYEYNAQIVRWVDGDTVWLNVDMGFRITHRTAFRLIGVDTPERGTLGYLPAIEAVNTWAPVGNTVHIRTYPAPDKYGRWLVDIDISDTATITQLLIEAGLGRPYYGGTKDAQGTTPAPINSGA